MIGDNPIGDPRGEMLKPDKVCKVKTPEDSESSSQGVPDSWKKRKPDTDSQNDDAGVIKKLRNNDAPFGNSRYD